MQDKTRVHSFTSHTEYTIVLFAARKQARLAADTCSKHDSLVSNLSFNRRKTQQSFFGIDSGGQWWPWRERGLSRERGLNSEYCSAFRRGAVGPLQVACHIKRARRSVACAQVQTGRSTLISTVSMPADLL
jgi:hypothetical protein